ncbi:hypothetical protein FOS14_07310 [Skermania sp. ID1734]|uniref:hypothetical protein n=1 Tax=Skermania sp. ID1734 TaxID=2597516 RepID=UPI00117DFEE3|nr:hypothetical protein [Skermania sp. ID1734]TSE00805.1 hypothetical protein FOS14_07310 [Skermania sp. ID1734]
MAKLQKFHASHINIQTRLPGERLAQLSKAVGDDLGNKVINVRFEGAQPGCTLFSVRGWGDMAEYLTFQMQIADSRYGSTGKSYIERYKTSQQTYFFIPVSPREMRGYGMYKAFIVRLGHAVRAEDPEAHVVIIERPGVQR